MIINYIVQNCNRQHEGTQEYNIEHMEFFVIILSREILGIKFYVHHSS